MKNRDMANLIARASAAIESLESLTEQERKELVQELQSLEDELKS